MRCAAGGRLPGVVRGVVRRGCVRSAASPQGLLWIGDWLPDPSRWSGVTKRRDERGQSGDPNARTYEATTLIVITVRRGFGFLSDGKSSDIEFAGVPARGLVTYVVALLIDILYAMEVKFVLRFYRIVESGRRIKQQYSEEH